MIFWFLVIEFIFILIGLYVFFIAPKLDAYNRGLRFLTEGNIDEAILEFTRAVEKDENNYEAHYRLAQLYKQKGVLIKAEEHFRKILEIGRFNEEINKLAILQEVGKIQFELKRLQEAFFTFKEILMVFPHDFTANYYLGLLHAGQLDYQRAIEYFTQAANSRPTDLKTFVNLGLCYVQIEDFNKAIASFEQALKLAPNNDDLNYYIGIALYMAGTYKRVPEYLLKVIQTTKDNEWKYMSFRLLIRSFFMEKKEDKVNEFLDSAIEFAKSNSLSDEYKQLLFDYGMMNILFGNYDIARSKLKLLKGIDPYNTDVDELIEYVEWLLNPDAREETEEEIELDLTPAAAAYLKHTHPEEEEIHDSKKAKFETVFNRIKEMWEDSFLNENYLWLIGGLTSTKRFNIEILDGQDKLDNIKDEASKITSANVVKEFLKVDRKKFIDISRKLVLRLGYNIIKENLRPDLADFVEGDGVDFVAKEIGGAGVITLIQVRRWDQGKVGEIPLRNLTQQMYEAKAKKGVFICPAQFTEGAQKFVESNGNIVVYSLNELPKLLVGLF